MDPTKGVLSGGFACGPRSDATRNRSVGDPGRPLSGQRAGRFNHHISPTPAAPPQLRAPALHLLASAAAEATSRGSGGGGGGGRLATPGSGGGSSAAPGTSGESSAAPDSNGGSSAAPDSGSRSRWRRRRRRRRRRHQEPSSGSRRSAEGHGFRRRQLGGSRLGRAGHSPYIPRTKTAVAGLLPQSYAQLSSVRDPRRRPSRG